MPDHARLVEFWFALTPPPVKDPVLVSDDVAAAFRAESVEHLGSGAFAETWRVVTSGTPQAVKVILDPSYPVLRLEQEAEGLRRGACSNVVQLHEVGRAYVGGEHRAYFRCEFIEGGDSAQHLRTGPWPDDGQQVAFCRGVLTGLAALHQANSVHRDLKFENVALRDGCWATPVLLDLGLVRLEDRSSLTLYPAFMGTPAFMAPEQLRQERAKKATDLWALGIMMFILAEKRHPFYPQYKDRLPLDDALDALRLGPPDTSACPEPLRELVARWLDPVIYRRGSAKTALRQLTLGDD